MNMMITKKISQFTRVKGEYIISNETFNDQFKYL